MGVMIMNCFYRMADQWKTLSQEHCQRFSPSQISDMLQAGSEPAQNISSKFE